MGGPALEELRKGDLCGVTQLEELTVHGNNLRRFVIPQTTTESLIVWDLRFLMEFVP